MSLNFKKTTLFIFIVSGFLFFLINAYKLDSNYNNIKIPDKNQSSQNKSIIKDFLDQSQAHYQSVFLHHLTDFSLCIFLPVMPKHQHV